MPNIGWKSSPADLESLIKDHPCYDFMPVPEMVSCSWKGLHQEEEFAITTTLPLAFPRFGVVSWTVCRRCGLVTKHVELGSASRSRTERLGYIADADPYRSLVSYLLLLS